MKSQQQRLYRLKRLERIREVAHLKALEKAAEAEHHFSRQAELARRSKELSAAYAHRVEGQTGADFRELRNFHAGLQALSDTTERESIQARKAADIHRQDAANAERRRDLVMDQRRSSERGLKKAKTARQLAGQPVLARSLNNDP